MTVLRQVKCFRCRDSRVVPGPDMAVLQVFGDVVAKLSSVPTFVDCPVCGRGGASEERPDRPSSDHVVGGAPTGYGSSRPMALRLRAARLIVSDSPSGGNDS